MKSAYKQLNETIILCFNSSILRCFLPGDRDVLIYVSNHAKSSTPLFAYAQGNVNDINQLCK